jgi:hypothetical protein
MAHAICASCEKPAIDTLTTMEHAVVAAGRGRNTGGRIRDDPWGER